MKSMSGQKYCSDSRYKLEIGIFQTHGHGLWDLHRHDSKIEFFEPHKIGRRQKRVNVRELFQGAFQRIQQHGTQIACVFYVFAALMALFGVICLILHLVLFKPADYLSWLLLLWLFYVFGYYINAFIKECNACFRNNNNQIHSIELAENGPAAAGANGQ
ncbi:hypothetical protein niasHT_013815 [Heterodera trifolii]|uniref:Uncharacterized protein n=1 Tax=Heterodera trifolii TaxID=157864 RepID=A0ABD2KUA0_9BILA